MSSTMSVDLLNFLSFTQDISSAARVLLNTVGWRHLETNVKLVWHASAIKENQNYTQCAAVHNQWVSKVDVTLMSVCRNSFILTLPWTNEEPCTIKHLMSPAAQTVKSLNYTSPQPRNLLNALLELSGIPVLACFCQDSACLFKNRVT